MVKVTSVKSIFPADFLLKIKEILLKEKTKFESEIKNSDENADMSNYGDSEEDNAQKVVDLEASMSIEKDMERSLRDVNSSLKRLEKGDYGICRYCNKVIEEKRLLARPTSSACVACKKTIIQEV